MRPKKIANLLTVEMEGAPPIYLRKGTSDEIIFAHTFSEEPEYQLPPGANPKLIFDVGANIGLTSIMMANEYPEATIHAFEPQEENFVLLNMNTRDYPNIKVHNFGLGAKSQIQNLFASDDPSNHGGFSLHALGCDTKKAQAVAIEAIDSFLESVDGDIDMIKIDAEGAEHEVLTSIPIERLKNTMFILGELHGTKDFETLGYLRHHGFDLSFMKQMQSRVFNFYAQNVRLLNELKKAEAEKVSATETEIRK